MSDYPSLAEMDIKGYEEITRYSVVQDRPDRDILRITYKRKKGSMLPGRKTFRFGRSTKMRSDASVPGGVTQFHEISPVLQKVMLELDAIVGKTTSKKERINALVEQIEQLERDTKFATAEMKRLLKEL